MRVIILASSPDHVEALSKSLEAEGLSNLKILKNIGVIIGECEEQKMAELAKIPGVQSITKDERNFKIC